jgi:hypothetical protein
MAVTVYFYIPQNLSVTAIIHHLKICINYTVEKPMNQSSKISITFPRTKICTAAGGTLNPLGVIKSLTYEQGGKPKSYYMWLTKLFPGGFTP